LASFGSFLTVEASGGTISGNEVVCVKLALAAVEATDCAIDGTVNCANLEEGRPALAGTDAFAIGAGAAKAGLMLVGAGVTLALLAGAGAAVAFAIVVFTESFALTFVVGLTALTATLAVLSAFTAIFPAAFGAIPATESFDVVLADFSSLTFVLTKGLAAGLVLTAGFSFGLVTVTPLFTGLLLASVLLTFGAALILPV
jgi:hypothetical protein